MILRSMKRHRQTRVCLDARETRNAYAELLRQFASGRMTNFEYERRYDRLVAASDSMDPAVDSIYSAAWYLYCDLREHRLTSPKYRLPRKWRRLIAKWVLYLYSDLEHMPEESSARQKFYLSSRACLTIIMTLGICGGAVGITAGLVSLTAAGWLFTVSVVVFAALVIWDYSGYLGVANEIVPSIDCEAPWPFPSIESYRAALESPKYLIGASHSVRRTSWGHSSQDSAYAD